MTEEHASVVGATLDEADASFEYICTFILLCSIHGFTSSAWLERWEHRPGNCKGLWTPRPQQQQSKAAATTASGTTFIPISDVADQKEEVSLTCATEPVLTMNVKKQPVRIEMNTKGWSRHIDGEGNVTLLTLIHNSPSAVTHSFYNHPDAAWQPLLLCTLFTRVHLWTHTAVYWTSWMLSQTQCFSLCCLKSSDLLAVFAPALAPARIVMWVRIWKKGIVDYGRKTSLTWQVEADSHHLDRNALQNFDFHFFVVPLCRFTIINIINSILLTMIFHLGVRFRK